MEWQERPRGSVAALERDGWSEFRSLLLRLDGNQEKILEIARLARRRKHALFGAHARNAHVPNDPRSTKDLDLLVPDAAAAARFGDVIVRRVPGVTLRTFPFGMVRVIDRKSKTKIADLVPADEAITMAAMATAKRKLVPMIGPMRVPPREIIAAMKLDSASDPRRPKLRAQQDVVDAQYVLDSKAIDKRALAAALSLVSPRAAKLLTKLRKPGQPWD